MSGIKIETRGKGTIEFGVMSLPNRKSKILYKTRGCMTETLAYFRSDECADEFEKIMEFMLENIR